MREKRIRRWEAMATAPGFRPTQLPGRVRGRRLNPRWLVYGLGVLIICGLVGVGGMIRHIQIEGSNQAESVRQATRAVLADTWLGWHLLGVDPDAVAEKLMVSQRADIAMVAVRRNWLGGSLQVAVQERAPALRWQTNQKSYAVDQLGVVTEAGNSRATAVLPLIIDATSLPVTSGQTVVPSSFVSFVRELNQQLATVTRLTLRQGRVLETTNELYADVSAGWYIRLDTTRGLTEQLAAVKRLLDHGVKPTAYIDVRLPYKAYYR